LFKALAGGLFGGVIGNKQRVFFSKKKTLKKGKEIRGQDLNY